MSKNEKRGPMALAQPPEQPLETIVISTFGNGAPRVQCSGDLVTAIRLLAIGLTLVSQDVQRAREQQRAVEDRKRDYLGPREG